MSTPFSIQNLATGLTLRAVVYDVNDVVLETITTGFTEPNDGEYRWEYTPTEIGYITFESWNGATWDFQAEATIDFAAVQTSSGSTTSLITPAQAKALIPSLTADDAVVQQVILGASEWLLNHPYIDPAKVLALPSIASMVCAKLVQAMYNRNVLNGLGGESLGDYSYSIASSIWSQAMVGPEVMQLLQPLLYHTTPQKVTRS